MACALPQWKVTAFIGENVITAQTIWQGIWMTYVVQSTGQMQCKVFDSILALPHNIQAARAPIIISIMMGLLGILLAMAGGKCTNCMEDERAKSRIGIGFGVVFIIVGVLCLIPVCWSAYTIIRDYNPLLTSSQKMELGTAHYIGWWAADLMITGGGFLCANCPCKEDNYPTKYSVVY